MTLFLIAHHADLIQPMVRDLYLMDVRRRPIIPIVLRLIILTALTTTTSIATWVHLELLYPESHSSKLHSVILFNFHAFWQILQPMLLVPNLLISCQLGCLLILVTHDLPCKVEMVHRFVLINAVRFEKRLGVIDPIRATFVNDREKLLVFVRASEFWHDSLEIGVVTDQHTAPHQLYPAIFQDFRFVVEETMGVSVPEQGTDL